MIYIFLIIVFFILFLIIISKEEDSTPKKKGPRKDVYIEPEKTETIINETVIPNEKSVRKILTDAEISGRLGEKYVLNVLKKDEVGVQRIINNFRFRVKGITVEIDHVVICEQGLFIVETKNHQGNIYGLDKAVYWKQYLGNNIYSLYNPIIQNETHVRTFRKRTNCSYNINSLVVFASAKMITIRKKESSNTKVIMLKDLKNNIYSGVSVLSDKEIEKTYILLNSIREKDNVSAEEHVRNVKKYLNEIQEMKK